MTSQKSLSNDSNKTDVSSYKVLARKYRPKTFDDLIGQDFLVRIISNAFKRDRIAHAFLFTGVRGVGKTTAARIIAKGMNCINDNIPTVSPCGKCDSCEAAANDRHVDIIEIDAASHTGVDDMRELTEGVRYKPAVGRYRIYIIDEVHMLSSAAFNALLKTLEEPPPHSKFIFCTTEVRKIPITVLSRCQRFDLRRVSDEILLSHLNKIIEKEKVSIDEDSLKIIVHSSDGSVRDSLSLLDQAISVNSEGKVNFNEVKEMLGLSDRELIWNLFDFLSSGDPNELINSFNDLINTGSDPLIIIEDLMSICHLVTRQLSAPLTINSEIISEYDLSRARNAAEKINMPILARFWQMLQKGYKEIQSSISARDAAEMVLLRITYSADLPDLKELMQIDDNKKKKLVENDSKSNLEESLEKNNKLDIEKKNELNYFEGLLNFLKLQKEIALYTDLSDKIRLLDYRIGYLKFSVEGEYKDDFIKNIRNKLSSLTNLNWNIDLSDDDSAHTYTKLKDMELNIKKENIRNNPLVESIIDNFPDSQISEIKDK